MNHRNVLIMLVLAAIGLMSTKPAMAQTATICNPQPIPAGWVVIRKDLVPNCSPNRGVFTNSNVIKVPGSSEWICNWSPKPDGYVFVGQRGERFCDSNLSFSGISLNIKVPGYEELVCAYSPIPSGYTVIARHINAIRCGPLGTLADGLVIRRNF
jgi:hypothetical protein